MRVTTEGAGEQAVTTRMRVEKRILAINACSHVKKGQKVKEYRLCHV
jgi:hypothetical protein